MLRRIWANRTSQTPEKVIHAAPLDAVTHLGMAVQEVQGIAGSESLAGVMDRQARKILISTRFSMESRRFTLAHELGHVLLHPGTMYFRDRSMEAPDFSTPRPYYEIEADAFAAEFLMPFKYLRKEFCDRFKEPLDSFANDPEVIRILAKAPRAVSVRSDQRMSILDRARLIASATTFGFEAFVSLHRHFKVSKTAMAIQLLQTRLVR